MTQKEKKNQCFQIKVKMETELVSRFFLSQRVEEKVSCCSLRVLYCYIMHIPAIRKCLQAERKGIRNKTSHMMLKLTLKTKQQTCPCGWSMREETHVACCGLSSTSPYLTSKHKVCFVHRAHCVQTKYEVEKATHTVGHLKQMSIK